MSDQKITIDTRLSIQWRKRDVLQQTEQIDFKNASAIQLLDVLELQQSSTLLNSIENNNNQNKQSDLSRLESKIDLLILLFTRNQYKQYSNIPNYDVRLSADTLTIKTTETLELNQLVEIDIFFNQNCPEPIVLSGKIVAADHPNVLAISLCNLGQTSQTFLEKYIFRLHRKEIARIKQS